MEQLLLSPYRQCRLRLCPSLRSAAMLCCLRLSRSVPVALAAAVAQWRCR